MKVILMAGGKGTRISQIFSDVPKPMIKIADKPILQHQIEILKAQNFHEFIITVSHMSNQIINYFGDGDKFGVNIKYFNELTPLGNAGALLKMKHELEDDDFLLLNADIMFDVDFKRFTDFHKNNKALVTLFTHPNNHPFDSAILIANDKNQVLEWLSKEDPKPDYYKNRVNAGLHVISPEIFKLLPEFESEKIDLDRQILKPLCKTGRIFCYDSPEYVKDMGTPERYKAVCEDFITGKIHARNLKNKQRAIFLDRDGTLNKYVGFLRDIKDFELLPDAAEAVKIINASGFLAIVVTNQPVIARGEVTFEELNAIHNKFEYLLGKKGAFIDKIYYCPHHPDKGFEGERPELKFDCECRKPKPGMILKAAEDFNIDLNKSYVIGDSKSDIQAGINAGCKTVLVNNSNDYGQDYMFENLLSFAVKIIKDTNAHAL